MAAATRDNYVLTSDGVRFHSSLRSVIPHLSRKYCQNAQVWFEKVVGVKTIPSRQNGWSTYKVHWLLAVVSLQSVLQHYTLKISHVPGKNGPICLKLYICLRNSWPSGSAKHPTDDEDQGFVEQGRQSRQEGACPLYAFWTLFIGYASTTTLPPHILWGIK